MLQDVINLQNDAVNKMLDLVGDKEEIVFKSPTGSGKTYMMASFMNKLLTEDDDVVFFVSSLSKGDLSKQNYQKFISYQRFTKLKPYLISSETAGEDSLFIPLEYNVYVLPRDLYKDGSKLKQGAMQKFLYNMTSMIPLGKGKKIYLIKDECHIATNNLDSLKEKYFSKVINFSATPNLRRGQVPDVEITEAEAERAKLIKHVEYQPLDESLDDALRKYLDVREQYRNSFGINPCMIIQISNKNNAETDLKTIFASLEKPLFHGLKWMLIVDKEKDCDTNDFFKAKKLPVSKWKEYAKSETAAIDIIIFKMVITEGWDIPRACMLYQMRDTQSTQLDEQVLGRVRRNPKLETFETLTDDAKSLATTAFVWGLKASGHKIIRQVSLFDRDKDCSVRQEFKLKTTKIKSVKDVDAIDYESIIANRNVAATPSSIFNLYRRYEKSTPEVKELCDEYSDSYAKWFGFMECETAIREECTRKICDYEESMVLRSDEEGNEIESTFPLVSYYEENGYFKRITNWVWQRTDGEEEFSFDSKAEKEFAELLIELIAEDAPNGNGRAIKRIPNTGSGSGVPAKYALGKNYLTDSEIIYEYYLKGIHKSYPDFVMKDWKDRIHIIEVKSVNESNTLSINADDYMEKVKALRDAYMHASRLVDYYFYIPIMQGNSFIIYSYFSGNEKLIDVRHFKNFIMGCEEL